MTRNESETRSELIDPVLTSAGWGTDSTTRIMREYRITDGRIEIGGVRGLPEIADYILVLHGQKVAVIEAKRESLGAREWVMQAKVYAEKLDIRYTYATNGHEIYEIDMQTGEEKMVDTFPTPDELWTRLDESYDEWRERFRDVPFESIWGSKWARYYQELAVAKTLEAVAREQDRILLTLATGTGKTFISFQIAWKLYQSRWNITRDGTRRPRILFLADRNILADQAFNAFSAFPEDALVRINPRDIAKKGNVPKNGSIFFTIFQTFMSGPMDAEWDPTPYFWEYERDFFDLIIIDECHRGGAKDESQWRAILEYFAPATQLGLTATPKKANNLETYRYFGNPVYTYSLKDGINDGFLTPFKVKRIQTTLDTYQFVPDDEVVEWEIEATKNYEEKDFNRTGGIEIEARERKRVELMMREIDESEKTIVFCATQAHAALVRDLINQAKKNKNPLYCVRVTAFDWLQWEMYLRDFQDNEKTIPTILTTSQKLSTGVDARNVRNIVLLRPVNSMIEFKQIIGRGTRIFEWKTYFTILDFVGASYQFADPEWDGDPIVPTEDITEATRKIDEKSVWEWDKAGNEWEKWRPWDENWERPKTVKIKLRQWKEIEIDSMMSTSFWSPDGKPMSHQEFLDKMFRVMPEFFQSESELRSLWANPITRVNFLDKIREFGFDKWALDTLTKMIHAEKSDLFDVLAYYNFQISITSRIERVRHARTQIATIENKREREFLEFILGRYVESGWEELSAERLPQLLKLNFWASITDAQKQLWKPESIKQKFFELQETLYQI